MPQKTRGRCRGLGGMYGQTFVWLCVVIAIMIFRSVQISSSLPVLLRFSSKYRRVSGITNNCMSLHRLLCSMLHFAICYHLDFHSATFHSPNDVFRINASDTENAVKLKFPLEINERRSRRRRWNDDRRRDGWADGQTDIFHLRE